ncbi:MAG: hypothetical protein ACK4JF_08210 [Methylohalobius sp.]
MSANIEARVDRLEEALMKLAYAQFNTEVELQKLSREMAAFKEELRQDTKALKEEMAAFKEEMLAFKEESRAERREMNKRWGEIANKLGTIVEDIVYPGFVGIAYAYFGAQDTELEAQRIKRQSQKDKSLRREFDGVIAWDGKLLLLEAKAAIRPEYLQAFAEFVEGGQVFDYFPEYLGYEFIPVFGALCIPESDVAFLTQKKIYCLAMGEEAMELLNGREVDRLRGKTS